MTVALYRGTQILRQSLPILVIGAAAMVVPEVQETVVDTYRRLMYQPTISPPPRRMNSLWWGIPFGSLVFAANKYWPEIQGTIPRELIRSHSEGKPVKRPIKPPASSKMIPPAIRKTLDSFGHLEPAEQYEQEIKARLHNQYVREGWRIKKKTPEQLEKDKKIAEAITAYLDWRFFLPGKTAL
jgi:hypothetical protein